MKKIIASALIVLWATGHHSFANQIGPVGKGVSTEEGTARYYAANLKGKLTSFGEKYDDSQLTASHSKFPLNTLLKVTNLENNLSVQVRVNDYCKCEEEGKIINLSKEAASKLGMMASGKAKVRLEVVSHPTAEKTIEKALDNLMTKGREVSSKEEAKENKIVSNSAVPVPPFSMNRTYDINGTEKSPKGFGVQVTALSSLNMVQDLYDELVKMGIKKEEIYVQVGEKDSNKIFRLMFGEFYTKEAATEKLTWLSQRGYKGVIRSHYNL
ncbi:septal ring lytic transglycosylase RlpA family protein [Arcicella sp. LKC2W]|uniref:septal ring lytic transglycosylase RlpA family protein n=1 Tax=Arcicella sp. LKC2W TaxID=2984198 RepID=UPI002B215F8A|nr:septal ring lytic transglycosylase RlpA family protein [Arcicella sp. LKC2W]MEA5458645.1 septal ring lytic transglycosylase RlpA family protein [Arcicella sp. LKC2W]